MGDEATRGVCVGATDGPPLPVTGGRLLIGGEQTAGRLAAVRSSAPPGDVVPPHVHHEADECFYVLAGRYTVTCGDETFEAVAGSFVYLPRGPTHTAIMKSCAFPSASRTWMHRIRARRWEGPVPGPGPEDETPGQ